MQFIPRDVPPRDAWTLEQAGVHPLLARLYAARGVNTADALDASLAKLLPPTGLKGVQQAAELLANAMAATRPARMGISGKPRLAAVASPSVRPSSARASIQATTEHNAKGAIKQQVVNGLIGPAGLRQLFGMQAAEQDKEYKGQEVHQPVPVNRQGTNADGHRIELGVNQIGHRVLQSSRQIAAVAIE